jgi:hypothetical protein
MKAFETYSGLAGFYVLAHDGQLGMYDREGKFVVDARLTQLFGSYNAQYLKAYLSNPDQDNFRLAIVYHAHEKKPWNSETFFLEEPFLRRLYPLSGPVKTELTVFQKRNREKSIFRGMETLLEYKDVTAPETPVFCPVLYDRDTYLEEYLGALDRKEMDSDRTTPVVEVLNLLAMIPVGRRHTEEIIGLKKKLYEAAVKKSARKSSDLSLIESIRSHSATGQVTGGVYADVDKRADRSVTLDSIAARTITDSSSMRPEELCLAKDIAKSLEGKPRPADPDNLRVFSKFHDLDMDKLATIGSRSLVYCVPAGVRLLELGTSDSWNLYLLDGRVEMVAADGAAKCIDGGTDKAKNPVASLKPRMYSVNTVTRVVFLWVDDKVVEEAVHRSSPARRDALGNP